MNTGIKSQNGREKNIRFKICFSCFKIKIAAVISFYVRFAPISFQQFFCEMFAWHTFQSDSLETVEQEIEYQKKIKVMEQ